MLEEGCFFQASLFLYEVWDIRKNLGIQPNLLGNMNETPLLLICQSQKQLLKEEQDKLSLELKITKSYESQCY